MTPPRTGAQRQAAHKARQEARGLVKVTAWVPALDAPALLAIAKMWADSYLRQRPAFVSDLPRRKRMTELACKAL